MEDTQEIAEVQQIYIREAAEMLNRRMATLRKWEQLDILPEELRSHRGHRGWRYWTLEQIEGIRNWLRDTDRRPGKGLPHYNPTATQLDAAIEAMRTGQKSRRSAVQKTDDFEPKIYDTRAPVDKKVERKAKRPPASFRDKLTNSSPPAKPRTKPGT